MELNTGFILYTLCAAIVAALAGIKGLSWAAYLLLTLAGGFVVVMALSIATQGAVSNAEAFSAFLVPLVALLAVIFSKNAKQVAVEQKQVDEYKKCPVCAGSVGREVIKCMHCASSL